MSVWRVPPRCAVSGKTAVRQKRGPRVLRRAKFKRGTRNADIGGGPFDEATQALAGQGVENVIFDPVNRSAAENQRAVETLACGGAETATVSNVLNVIPDPECRQGVIRQAADAVGLAGTAFFAVYEGNRSGRGRKTPYGWQENRRLASYVPEVESVFADVKLERGVIVARRPRNPTCSTR